MKLILERNRPAYCPHCGSDSLHRSRRKHVLESFLHHVLFMSPYRCNECAERHFRFRIAKQVQHPSTTSPRHAS